MNFIFIAPNFPDNYRYFCDRLSRNGVSVLCIGDAPYDSLKDEQAPIVIPSLYFSN